MAKYAIYYEQDDAGKDTGRVQVVEETDDLVFATFDTEEEAEIEMAKLQAESDRKDKIMAEYLEWEEKCLTRHSISQEELRIFLVNVVID